MSGIAAVKAIEAFSPDALTAQITVRERIIVGVVGWSTPPLRGGSRRAVSRRAS